jgi:hypothetical protein
MSQRSDVTGSAVLGTVVTVGVGVGLGLALGVWISSRVRNNGGGGGGSDSGAAAGSAAVPTGTAVGPSGQHFPAARAAGGGVRGVDLAVMTGGASIQQAARPTHVGSIQEDEDEVGW